MNIQALVVFALSMLLGACGRIPTPADLPIVHKIDVEQGNVITQDMLAQLRPGMDRAKVRFIMGTPIIADTFHADRWDYLYSFSKRGGRREQRRVALYFEEDKLVRVEGNIKAAQGELKPTREKTAMVEVPDTFKPTLIERVKSKVGLGDDDRQAADKDKDDDKDKDEAESQSESGETELAETESETGSESGQSEDNEAAEVDVTEDEGDDKPGLFARMARRVGIGKNKEEQDTALGEESESSDEAASEEETLTAQQETPEESVLVPEDAPPPKKKKKGFFGSILEKVGIGDDEENVGNLPDRGYKDPTEIDTPF